MDKESFKENAHKASDEVKENIKRAKKTKLILSVLKLLLLIGIVVAVPYISIFISRIFSHSSNPLTMSSSIWNSTVLKAFLFISAFRCCRS